jgi:hypothetical protein
MHEDVPPESVKDELIDLIYRIDPDEVSVMAPGVPRPLTGDERERIVQLFLRKKWRKLRRFAKRLDRIRVPMSATDAAITEWLVQELYPKAWDDHSPGFSATAK